MAVGVRGDFSSQTWPAHPPSPSWAGFLLPAKNTAPRPTAELRSKLSVWPPTLLGTFVLGHHVFNPAISSYGGLDSLLVGQSSRADRMRTLDPPLLKSLGGFLFLAGNSIPLISIVAAYRDAA